MSTSAWYCVKGTPEQRESSFRSLPQTHTTGRRLLEFVWEYEQLGGGGGRMFRAAISTWFATCDIASVEKEIEDRTTKYELSRVLQRAHVADDKLDAEHARLVRKIRS